MPYGSTCFAGGHIFSMAYLSRRCILLEGTSYRTDLAGGCLVGGHVLLEDISCRRTCLTEDMSYFLQDDMSYRGRVLLLTGEHILREVTCLMRFYAALSFEQKLFFSYTIWFALRHVFQEYIVCNVLVVCLGLISMSAR